jgi:hypothetical protein
MPDKFDAQREVERLFFQDWCLHAPPPDSPPMRQYESGCCVRDALRNAHAAGAAETQETLRVLVSRVLLATDPWTVGDMSELRFILDSKEFEAAEAMTREVRHA